MSDFQPETAAARVSAAVKTAAALVRCTTENAIRELSASTGGLTFDSPEAEAIVARAEDLLGAGALAEVADLDTGEPATLETLTELLTAKLIASESEGSTT